MTPIASVSAANHVPVGNPATSPPEAPPAPESPAPPADQVEVGRDEPSLGYRLLRGAAGVAGGAVVAAGRGAVGGIKHAGDHDIELPKAVESTARIIGAGAGAIKGALLGATVAGPVGIAVGLVVGPIVGAYAGGAFVGGLEGAANAAKGVGQGVIEGFKKGSEWTRDLVDRMAARPAAPTPPAPPAPEPPRPYQLELFD